MLNPSLFDPYVLYVLEQNGWNIQRIFTPAEVWIAEIQRQSIPCFTAAREILLSFGGIAVQEASPSAALYFLEKYQGDTFCIEPKFLRPLAALQNLGLLEQARLYTGADFHFHALEAFSDREIVMDMQKAQHIVGERLFPIGTVEPDGLCCAAESGKIYTLFSDTIFLSGNNIADFCNSRFLAANKPACIYRAY